MTYKENMAIFWEEVRMAWFSLTVLLQKPVVEKPSTAVGEVEHTGGPREVNTPSCVPRTKGLQNVYRQCMTSNYSG